MCARQASEKRRLLGGVRANVRSFAILYVRLLICSFARPSQPASQFVCWFVCLFVLLLTGRGKGAKLCRARAWNTSRAATCKCGPAKIRAARITHK